MRLVNPVKSDCDATNVMSSFAVEVLFFPRPSIVPSRHQESRYTDIHYCSYAFGMSPRPRIRPEARNHPFEPQSGPKLKIEQTFFQIIIFLVHHIRYVVEDDGRLYGEQGRVKEVRPPPQAPIPCPLGRAKSNSCKMGGADWDLLPVDFLRRNCGKPSLMVFKAIGLAKEWDAKRQKTR